MNATVIDTLRFANRLKDVGFKPTRAEGMACALGDELAERMLTRRDLDEFKVVIDARFEAVDAKIDGLDTKIESVRREVSGKFNVLVGVMALGFTLLGGLVTFTASSQRAAAAPAEAVAPHGVTGRVNASTAAPDS